MTQPNNGFGNMPATLKGLEELFGIPQDALLEWFDSVDIRPFFTEFCNDYLMRNIHDSSVDIFEVARLVGLLDDPWGEDLYLALRSADKSVWKAEHHHAWFILQAFAYARVNRTIFTLTTRQRPDKCAYSLFSVLFYLKNRYVKQS